MQGYNSFEGSSLIAAELLPTIVHEKMIAHSELALDVQCEEYCNFVLLCLEVLKTGK
jgi:hypothetical protein